MGDYTYARWERGEQEPESPKLVALAFEALIARRIKTEAEDLRSRMFQTDSKSISQILNKIDRNAANQFQRQK